MLFNSIEFLFFLPIVFILYWFVFNKNLKIQNLLILVCSYVFYAWWDYRFLSLIFLSTIVDYIIGLNIPKQKSEKNQKLLLWCSVLFNLSVLGFFKYYNFFVDSWIDLFNSIGYEIKSVWTLNIILPVGISFYTFQTMSYTIDIYRKKLEPTKDFISFASFVSFFPQLVAGPIERASNLLPQILKKRHSEINYSKAFYLILTGLIRKMVFADNFSIYVDHSFSMKDGNVISNLLTVILFSFQIYFDFSGYSRVARGVSLLFGINLNINFNYPYKSRSLKEFWTRWHISLSSWFRDYIYFPIGGSLKGKFLTYRNLILVFLISGFWHGASLTFIVWGFIHGIFQIIEKEFKLKPSNIRTLIIVMLSWVFFRSESIKDSIIFLRDTFTLPKGIISIHQGLGPLKLVFIISLFIFMLIYQKHIEKEQSKILYFLFPFLIFFFSSINKSFIYFQF